MLYLKYRLSGGNSTHKNIKHLVIDEMQDYTYLQYTILESLFHCRMTILETVHRHWIQSNRMY